MGESEDSYSTKTVDQGEGQLRSRNKIVSNRNSNQQKVKDESLRLASRAIPDSQVYSNLKPGKDQHKNPFNQHRSFEGDKYDQPSSVSALMSPPDSSTNKKRRSNGKT